MEKSDSNPLFAALEAGLTYPIHAKLVGANGNTAEVLYQLEGDFPVPKIISIAQLELPIEWTLTGANQLTLSFEQNGAKTAAVTERVRKETN